MVGQTLGHYRVLELLGKGGMGEVYRAEDATLKREVALKILPTDFSSSQERLDRFQREAETLAALDHPNIVTIHTVEEADGVHFLTMQLVEGEPLSQLIPNGGMPLERIFDLAIPLADALATAHEKGVIHRDLKPANVMVTDEGRVKVLDFGLAKLRPEIDAPGGTELPTEPLTEEGKIVGTLPYMSPEQLEGKGINARSDIFSLGVMLYEMATGERPFRGASSASLITAIMSHSPREVDSLRVDLPHHLGRIIRHCLEKNPESRFQSVKDVRNELQDLQREEFSSVAVPATPEPEPEPARKQVRWPLVAAAVGGAAIVLAVFVVLWLGRSGAPTQSPVEALAEHAAAETQAPMIVVLPFENLGDPEDEYFADGMTEEITSRLAVVHGLGVISRTSAMQYKENRPSLRQIGEDLGVQYVLEGTVRWARDAGGERVRITPQLIRVADDRHLWADSYDRVIEDVFEIQSDIASEVIDQLGVSLGVHEREEIETRPTENLEAYQAYLQGLDYVNPAPVWDQDNLERAIRLFQRATELDPDFIAAHYQLARTHIWMHYAVESSEKRATLLEQAVDRLETLAPNSLEARLAAGFYDYYYSQDFDAARSEFEVAEGLRHNDAEVLAAIALIDRRQARWNDALRRFRAALDLDPRSAGLRSLIGQTLLAMRDYGGARQAFEESIALDPDQDAVYYSLAWTHWFGDGDLDRSRAALEAMPGGDTPYAKYSWAYQKMLERDFQAALETLAAAPRPKTIGCSESPSLVGEGRIYRLLGDMPRSRAAYEDVLRFLEPFVGKENREGAFSNCYLAEALAGLGQREQAMVHANRAIKIYPLSKDSMDGPCVARCVAEALLIAGDFDPVLDQLEILLSIPGSSTATVTRLTLDPVWDPLRDHPRFQALLEKYGKEDS